MTPATIITHTELVCGLAPRALRSRDRRRSVAEARKVAAYVARLETGASFGEIGAELGRTDGGAYRMVEAVEFQLGFGDRRLSRIVERVRLALAGR